MSSIHSSNLRTALMAGFLQGPAEGERYNPVWLEKLSRPIEITEPDQSVELRHLGDFGLPDKNAAAIIHRKMTGWMQILNALDQYSYGITLTEKDRQRVPECVARARALPNRWPIRLEDELWTMIVEGDGTAYGKIPDGATPGTDVGFFLGTGVGHVYPGDVEYKTAMLNLLQAAEVASLNIATPAAPTAAEWQVAVGAVRSYIVSHIKDTAGNQMFRNGVKFHLIVPPNMEGSVLEAFTAPLSSGGGTNIYRDRWVSNITIEDRLAADTAIWYVLLEIPGAEKPFWHPYRNVAGQRYSFAMTNESSDEYEASLDRPLKFSAVSEEKIVYGDWRMLYRCVFS